MFNILILLGFVFSSMGLDKTVALAQKWTDAYAFYNEYGVNAVFEPTTDTNGIIYCATRGNKSNSSVKYKTIGWEMIIKNTEGTQLQKLYFQLGGDYLKRVNTKTVSGYTYMLFSVSLSNMKKRFNTKVTNALSTGSCTLTLNACMIVVTNGKEGGTMDDTGIKSGKVYTTYSGIVNAQDWSEAAKTALKTYFGKNVQGLFFNVKVVKSKGIRKVSGAGKFCYGLKNTITAEADTGYLFKCWKNEKKEEVKKKNYSFVVTKDVTWTAYAKAKELVVNYHKNLPEDDEILMHTYYYAGGPYFMPNPTWTSGTRSLIGWSHTKDATIPEYTVENKISSAWINTYYPSTDLYGVWKIVSYKIEFRGRVVENIQDMLCGYEDRIRLPSNGRSPGWCLNPEADGDSYKAGEEMDVKELVDAAGLCKGENTITLYAVWDNYPTIIAEDRYYSLRAAQDGEITEYELASHSRAYDREDGDIQYSNVKENEAMGGSYFRISDYEAGVFTSLKGDSEVTITFEAVNSMGNKSEKKIKVYIVDTRVELEESLGKIRFINQKYYKDGDEYITEKAGGLIEDSCWKKLKEYYYLIESIFS